MDRLNRWSPVLRKGMKPVKPVRHARVSLKTLRCADCERELAQTHPGYLGDRCRWCWDEVVAVFGVGEAVLMADRLARG